MRAIMLADLKLACRRLLKHRSFTLVALVTLALGIGVNTSMFTILNAELMNGTPVVHSDRVITVLRTTPQAKDVEFHSPGSYKDLHDRSTAFEGLAAFTNALVNMAEPGQPAERLDGMAVSADFFPVFRVSPELGRTFTPEDDRAGAPRVAVLSDEFWRQRFAGNPAVLGRTLHLDGQLATVVGVMPARLDAPLYWGWGRVDVWLPLSYGPDTWRIRDNRWLQVVGRLRPGAPLAAAQGGATAVAEQLGREFPLTDDRSGFRLAPWDSVRVEEFSRRMTWVCMGLSGFVLFIACANLANLQLARAADQLHEHALRVALGASRLRILRQFLVESILLSVAGGGLGILAALWGTRLIGSEIVVEGVVGLNLPLDLNVLAFTLGAAVLTGALFGTAPAWLAGRLEVNAVLKQRSRGSTSGRTTNRLRHGLIIAELVLALVLLAGAGFFVRGMQRLAHIDRGWKADGLVTAGVTLPFNAKYTTEEQCRTFFTALETRIKAVPGVTDAGITANLPTSGFWQTDKVAVEGRPAEPGKEPTAYNEPVSADYFSTMGIRLLRGRGFNADDRPTTQAVAIVNAATAERLWPGEDPIGRRIGDVGPDGPSWRVVVGVVADIQTVFEVVRPAATRLQIYRPLSQVASHNAHYLGLALKTSVPLSTLGPELKQAVAAIDAELPVASILPAPVAMEQMISGVYVITHLLSAFALVGLVLSAVGLYGVIANLVAQRTAEIGFRLALGAQARQVLWMVMRQGMSLAVVGLGAGLAGAWALLRLLDSVMPAIPGGDPWALAAMAGILLLTALVACWLPARRATRIDPIRALRAD